MLKHLGVALLLCAQILLGWGSANAATVNTIVNTPGSALDVALADSYAYVADKNGGLRVIDISAPANPKQVAAVATPGSANSVALYGDYALVADSSVGLQLYNISSPLSPQAYAQLGITGSAVDVSVVGAMAYVAGGSGGLSLVNLDDMLSPFVSGRCVLSGSAQMVAMIDDLAYVAAGSGGVQLVDVGNPYDPTVIGQLATSSSVNQLSVAGDIIFAACADGTMLTIDASDPSEPVLAQKATPSGSSRALRVSTDLAYVADKANGLRVISIGDQLPGKLISPNGGEVYAPGDTVHISWSLISGAVSYQLYYADPADNNWIAIATVGAGTNQYAVPVPNIGASNLERRVRVKALNSSGKVIADDVSDGVFFLRLSAGTISTLNVPTSATSSSINANWSASSVAGVTYQLQMSKDGGAYQTAHKGIARSVTVAGLTNGHYRFRVRAQKNNYKPGSWSNVKTTVISGVSGGGDGPACGMPSALTVPATTTASTIPLSWSASSTSGVTYQAQMSSNGGSTWTTVYSGCATSKSVPVSAEGSYLFRVKAVKSGLAASGWAFSDACQTDLGTPTSLSVPATNSSGAITVSWGASATSGTSYVLQISNDGGSSYMEAYSGSATSSTVQVSSNGTYKFRVRATKSGYSASGWRSGGSCAVTFTCAAPASISVTANAAAKNFTVSWPASTTSGSSYILQMSVDGGAYTQVYSGSSSSKTVAVSSSGSYKFRVKAKKSGFTDSGWRTSVAKSITLQASATAFTAPGNGTTNSAGAYTLSWTPVSGATYVVQEATSSDFSTGLRTVASYTSATSVEITDRQDYLTYYYRVKVAVEGMVGSAWSDTLNISIEYPALPNITIGSCSNGSQTGVCKGFKINEDYGYLYLKFNKSAFPTGTLFTTSNASDCSVKVNKDKVRVYASNSWSFNFAVSNPSYRGSTVVHVSGSIIWNGD